MPMCERCNAPMAAVLKREGGVTRMVYECRACSLELQRNPRQDSASRRPWRYTTPLSEVGDGFVVLRNGERIRVRSTVRPADLVVGARVWVKVQLRGAEWIAEDLQVEG